MVRRNSGTTKLYINGVERDSATDSYTITSSNTVVLGADVDRGATGVKGYIADFFWTEEAVSFSQADFDPSTPEPVTFHSGNPSISSFSSSANSVENSGDTVTLSWSVSGETKLELLKYVGGLLSSTEDVLGLSSKSVTITETVSYKIRATNDNSAVDSSSVQITLGGGQSMSFGTLLSGNAQPFQLHGRVLGGFVTGSTDKQFFSLPVFGVTPGVTANHVTGGLALRTRFTDGSGSIISALNTVDGRIANQSLAGLSDTDASTVSAYTDGGILVADGSKFVLETGNTARSSLGLAIGSDVQAYDADLDVLSGMQTGGASALAALTSTEIAILDGATVSTAELNILDGVTATASELNILDGVTATASELNILDGVTSTASELNILDGATLDKDELNLLDGSIAKTAVASKAVIYGAEKGILGDYVSGSVAVSGALGAFHSLRLGSAAVTANASELNLLDAGAGSSVTLADGDSFIVFDATSANAGTKAVMSDILDYVAANDDERVQDIVGAMVTSNTEDGIAVAYQDSDGTLDFTVTVSAGNISNNAVGAAQIVTNGVGSLEIVANAINSDKILDGAVTSAQLAEVIDHSAASHALILEADGTADSGLFLKGTDNDGEAAEFQVVVVGGMMQLKKIAAPSASNEVTTEAVGTNGS
jgi:hypothetical protein